MTWVPYWLFTVGFFIIGITAPGVSFGLLLMFIAALIAWHEGEKKGKEKPRA